ncbi:MAG: copper chaperone [Arcticibacterium sp.]|jgi:copper chaperone
MKQIQFKTNINCGNCIKTVTPILNSMDEIDEWKVATENEDKVLTVDGEDFTAEEIISKLSEAGFNATQL